VSGKRGPGPRATGLRGFVLAATMLAVDSSSVLAQRMVRWELGPQVYALSGDRDAFGGGLYGAWRGGTRTRISLFAGAGGSGGTTVGRGEFLAHFLLTPQQRNGVGVYVAGGIGLDVVSDATASWVVATLGAEGSPAASAGWVLEGGVGGGWRVAAGWRWRWR